MELYKEIRRTGVIEYDNDVTLKTGRIREMEISHNGKLWTVLMFNGEVLKIERVA